MNITLHIVAILPWNLPTVPFINSGAFLIRSVLCLLSWNIIALLLSSIFSNAYVLSLAILSVLSATLLTRNGSAFFPRNLLTILFGNLVTDLFSGVVGVRNRLSSTILFRNLLAVLLRNLFALLAGFVPTLLSAINISALLLSY